MANEDGDNLKELFERFFDAKDASKALEDVRNTEQMLRENPAPEPDAELIADIKAQIAGVLADNKPGAFRSAVFKTAAVAAVFVILAIASVKIYQNPPVEEKKMVTASLIPTAIWESEDLAADDAELETLTAEIEQIEGELVSLDTEESDGEGYRDLTELELELIDIDSDFWKG